MSPVTGKRAGARRGAPPPRRLNPVALGICAAITLCVIAWGYLVYAAIDFGTAGRSGDGTSAWALMVLAALGAIACLFAGLMLGVRLLRLLGVLSPQALGEPTDSARPPAPQGGKRAAR